MTRFSTAFLLFCFEAISITLQAQALSLHAPSRGLGHVSSHTTSRAPSHFHPNYIPHSHRTLNPSIPIIWYSGLILTIKGDTLFGSVHIVSATDCVVEYREYTKNKYSYPDDVMTLFGKEAISRIRLFLTDSTTEDYVNLTDKKNLYKVISEGKVSIFDSDKGMLIVKGDTVEQI